MSVCLKAVNIVAEIIQAVVMENTGIIQKRQSFEKRAVAIRKNDTRYSLLKFSMYFILYVICLLRQSHIHYNLYSKEKHSRRK